VANATAARVKETCRPTRASRCAFGTRKATRRGGSTPATSRAIGTFNFANGADGFVEISTAGSRGEVCADAMIFKPLLTSPKKK
jgi:hypothetical protein